MSNVGRELPVTRPDNFGRTLNNQSDRTEGNAPSSAESVNQHRLSDVDSGPKSQHHTLGPKRNQSSPGNHTHDGTTSKRLIKDNKVLVSFTTQSSWTVPVTFKDAYPTGTIPVVTTNINSSAGVTARWGSRAYSVSETGFTIFLYKGDAADPAQTWSNVEVQWRATASGE